VGHFRVFKKPKDKIIVVKSLRSINIPPSTCQ